MQHQGTGLGLSIAKRISGILQHPISVRSIPGKGTVFALQVPLAASQELRANAANQAPVTRAQTEDGLAGTLVVCIDNDQQVLDAMRTLLTGWSCDVIAARSENDAVIGLTRRQRTPDILLADYHLDSGETGINVMQTLQQYFSAQVPGVLITADFSAEVKQAALASGFRYLRKPVNPGALRSLINNLLMQSRSRFSG